MSMPSATRFDRVAVLGTGLIGGSVAAAARASGAAAHVVGYSPGDDAHEALALGLIDSVAVSAPAAVVDADLVVLAAPVPALPGLFEAIRPNLAPNALIIDCASTKATTLAAARERLGLCFDRFIASHPIAGSNRHGPAAARADLFRGAVAILCPHPGNAPEAVARIAAFWAQMGARPTELAADRHDQVFAVVSHWPHALVFALCGAIARGEHAEDALRLAGAGLRDTSRIGGSAPELWADILLDNRQPVLQCAQAFEQELQALLQALRDGDREQLVRRFEIASRWRQRLDKPAI